MDTIGTTSEQMETLQAVDFGGGRKATAISLGKRCSWTSNLACKRTSPHVCPAVRVLAMFILAVPVCAEIRAVTLLLTPESTRSRHTVECAQCKLVRLSTDLV